MNACIIIIWVPTSIIELQSQLYVPWRLCTGDLPHREGWPVPKLKPIFGALSWTWLKVLMKSVRNCNRNRSVIGKSLCKLRSTSL